MCVGDGSGGGCRTTADADDDNDRELPDVVPRNVEGRQRDPGEEGDNHGRGGEGCWYWYCCYDLMTHTSVTMYWTIATSKKIQQEKLASVESQTGFKLVTHL